MNALDHGLTGRTVLLPSEDPAAHQRYTQEFFDEYQPQGPTEKQLVQELIDTSWRLNRVPSLEAELLSRAANPPTPKAAIEFDIVDAPSRHRQAPSTPTVCPDSSTRLSNSFARSRPSAATWKPGT